MNHTKDNTPAKLENKNEIKSIDKPVEIKRASATNSPKRSSPRKNSRNPKEAHQKAANPKKKDHFTHTEFLDFIDPFFEPFKERHFQYLQTIVKPRNFSLKKESYSKWMDQLKEKLCCYYLFDDKVELSIESDRVGGMEGDRVSGMEGEASSHGLASSDTLGSNSHGLASSDALGASSLPFTSSSILSGMNESPHRGVGANSLPFTSSSISSGMNESPHRGVGANSLPFTSSSISSGMNESPHRGVGANSLPFTSSSISSGMNQSTVPPQNTSNYKTPTIIPWLELAPYHSFQPLNLIKKVKSLPERSQAFEEHGILEGFRINGFNSVLNEYRAQVERNNQRRKAIASLLPERLKYVGYFQAFDLIKKELEEIQKKRTQSKKRKKGEMEDEIIREYLKRVNEFYEAFGTPEQVEDPKFEDIFVGNATSLEKCKELHYFE